MKVMAIDPGNEQSAFVTVDSDNYHVIMQGKHENRNGIILLQETDYQVVVIEAIASYGMAVGKEVFETCIWVGRFMQLALMLGKEVHLVYRKDVKLNLCDSPRAKDGNVIQALKDRFGDKGTKASPGFFYGFSKDVWQAYAVVVTWIDDMKAKGVIT